MVCLYIESGDHFGMCRVLHIDLDNNVFICSGISTYSKQQELAVNVRQDTETNNHTEIVFANHKM